MKLWGDMTAREREQAALTLVRKRGLSYSRAADELGATKNAINGTLARAEGRETSAKRKSRPNSARGRKAGVSQPDKTSWDEARLTEPWAVWRARRRAERDKAKENA